MKKSSKIILTIVIILLVISLGGLGYYTYTLNQKINDLETDKKENVKGTEETDEKQEQLKEEKEQYALFDKEVDISDICTDDNDCIKELGHFSLEDKIYTSKINLYSDESDKESYILIDTKKIVLEGYLRYIVKVNNNLLIVQEFNGSPEAKIMIYDKNLNLIKTYTTNSTSDNYFEVYNNKFTYYKCDSTDFENQKLKKYNVSIKEEDISEEFVSEKSIQCNFQE